ncbi:MAG: ATP-binding protein [Pseudomonadota bacterium]
MSDTARRARMHTGEPAPLLQVFQLVAFGAGCLIAGLMLPHAPLATAVAYAGAGLIAAAAFLKAYDWTVERRRTQRVSSLEAIADSDPSPCFGTAADGTIEYQNEAAIAQFGETVGEKLTAALGGVLASPDEVVARLIADADQFGSGREEVALRRGQLRLSVHQIGVNGLLWRVDGPSGGAMASRFDGGISLPMMTVSREDSVIYMNDALRRLAGGRRKALSEIVQDLPIRSGDAHQLATETGSREARIMEIPGTAGRRELYFLPIASDAEPVQWDMIDALPVPLLKLDRDGAILLANRMAKDLLLIEPGEKVRFGEVAEGLGRPLKDWVADAVSGRGLARQEFLRATRNAQDTYIQVTLSSFDDGGTPCAIAVLNDATELKTLEAQFVQSQKMQAIGQLAGGVAHDFNNLLTAISGHCDLLLHRRDPGDPDYSDLEQINQNANRAASLVGQLLAFSRKQNLQPELLDLRDAMADTSHLLNRLVGEKIALSFTHDPDTKRVRADRRQLEQVMMNLVVNARDAMPDGGAIEIETRAVTLAQDLERDRAVIPAGDYVMIEVRDQGIGIDPESMSKIFEPFYSTKGASGTGLGLSTVYGIVKQTGGYIFAKNRSEGGTVFTIFLPGQEVSAVEAPVQAASAPGSVAPPKSTEDRGVVLLVEDEAPVRAFASRALRMRGHTVIEAANAEEALEQLKDASLEVDVFVTDVIMPGKDGPTWVSEALEQRPETRVVFISGYAEESFADGQARIPKSVLLPKPFSLSQLTNVVQEQLH